MKPVFFFQRMAVLIYPGHLDVDQVEWCLLDLFLKTFHLSSSFLQFLPCLRWNIFKNKSSWPHSTCSTSEQQFLLFSEWDQVAINSYACECSRSSQSSLSGARWNRSTALVVILKMFHLLSKRLLQLPYINLLYVISYHWMMVRMAHSSWFFLQMKLPQEDSQSGRVQQRLGGTLLT